MFSKTIGNSFARSAVRRVPVVVPVVKRAGKPTVKVGVKIIATAVVIFGGFFVVCFNQTAYGQSTLNSASGLEFPVTMRKKIVAGVTAVGTPVQAKLAVATLVDGIVIPENAILSGEVTESSAKSDTDPSRLAICMDSARWKRHGTLQVLKLTRKVYLTAWSYPVMSMPIPDVAYQPPDLPGSRNTTRLGSSAPPTRRLPPSDDGSDSPASTPQPSSTSTSNAAPHRVLMKDVESTRARDGAVALTSRHFNIKLDKSTTYVFAGGELAVGRSSGCLLDETRRAVTPREKPRPS